MAVVSLVVTYIFITLSLVLLTFSFSWLKTITLRQGCMYVSYWLCCEWPRSKKKQVILYCHIIPWILEAHYKHSYIIHITTLRTIFHLITSDLWGLCRCHCYRSSHSFLYLSSHGTENCKSFINSILPLGNTDASNIIRGWTAGPLRVGISHSCLSTSKEWYITEKVFRERCIGRNLTGADKMRSGMERANKASLTTITLNIGMRADVLMNEGYIMLWMLKVYTSS